MLLDGKPTTILRADQNAIQFAPDIIVDADTFGQVFAGPAPTLAAVGALFGAYLQLDARHQQITLALQTIQTTHHALSLGGSSPLSLPPYRFDALTERALAQFDGTDEMTKCIADILAVPPTLVKAWAAQDKPLLTETASAQPVIVAEAETASATITDASDGGGDHQETSSDASVIVAANAVQPPMKWTPERLAALETAILTCKATTLKEAIALVAPSFECEPAAIHGQVYKHGINDRFKAKQNTPQSVSAMENQGQIAHSVQNVQETPDFLVQLSEEAQNAADGFSDQIPRKHVYRYYTSNFPPLP